MNSSTYVFPKTRHKSAILGVVARGFFKTSAVPYDDVDSTINSWMAMADTVAVSAYVMEDGNLRLVRFKTKEVA